MRKLKIEWKKFENRVGLRAGAAVLALAGAVVAACGPAHSQFHSKGGSSATFGSVSGSGGSVGSGALTITATGWNEVQNETGASFEIDFQLSQGSTQLALHTFPSPGATPGSYGYPGLDQQMAVSGGQQIQYSVQTLCANTGCNYFAALFTVTAASNNSAQIALLYTVDPNNNIIQTNEIANARFSNVLDALTQLDPATQLSGGTAPL